MSMLQFELPGARVVDLFAGSGALGLEALSRGAARADFVELAARSLAALHRNIAALDAAAVTTVHRGSALRFVERLPPGAYDMAFADPPYRMGLAARIAARWLGTRFAALLAVEHDVRETLPDGGSSHRYGDTLITVYRDGAPPSAP